ncbi:unnamed protein product [Didymodactylos carnosus]|uniref:Uncharacterized protein n=1 Tax=Didymodactylos carnosus TaxID=1234261 RepID=A0A814KFK4_9BILA|nr:unnamed protein product [Didymodactylos carnosus]CAF1048819.1 unnamed protein product [Didymodactylos carnosus]CAF3590021.1 unnamed protein product [Didymodactylos carnosus]CAF3818500.1 unnamed protein product [Didymodactylos carnosus]
MTYETGIFVFHRITDEKQWKLFLKAVYDYFLQHQNDNVRMTVNRNETTGEFQPLVDELNAVSTDLKGLHLTDQFNFITGDCDNSFFATWRINLAENLYGKPCYKLTEEEKTRVCTESIEKMRETMKRMNYSVTEDELLEIVGFKVGNSQKSLLVEPPVAISIEGITLPVYAHHFKKTRGQVWHPMCSESVIKIFYKLLKNYFSEAHHYCYFNELNYLNDPYEPPTRYYSSDRRYRQHATTETMEENDAFYQQIIVNNFPKLRKLAFSLLNISTDNSSLEILGCLHTLAKLQNNVINFYKQNKSGATLLLPIIILSGKSNKRLLLIIDVSLYNDIRRNIKQEQLLIDEKKTFRQLLMNTKPDDIRKLLGSLDYVFTYLQHSTGKQATLRIKSFVQTSIQNKTHLHSYILNEQQPFANIQLKYIINFYELIEELVFDEIMKNYVKQELTTDACTNDEEKLNIIKQFIHLIDIDATIWIRHPYIILKGIETKLAIINNSNTDSKAMNESKNVRDWCQTKNEKMNPLTTTTAAASAANVTKKTKRRVD